MVLQGSVTLRQLSAYIGQIRRRTAEYIVSVKEGDTPVADKTALKKRPPGLFIPLENIDGTLVCILASRSLLSS